MKQYTGKTEIDALLLACQEKKCTQEELIYRVVGEEKHFFGIGNSVTIEAYTRQDVKDFLFDYLGNYFQSLNLAVSIEIILGENDNYNLILDSEKNAIIIGKGGQTLRAIATVLRAAVNTEFKTNAFQRYIRLNLDINGYRQDRYQKVTLMAKRIAKEVARSHVDASLDPLPNDERKVIHQFLANFPHVRSESVGEGKERHIVIRYMSEDKTHKKENA